MKININNNEEKSRIKIFFQRLKFIINYIENLRAEIILGYFKSEQF